MYTFEDVRNYKFEQIVRHFGLIPNYANKILCPKHPETEPSFQVNERFGYCYGCKEWFDNFSMAKFLLEKRHKKEFTVYEVLKWFEETELPEASAVSYDAPKYEGPVPMTFINYWSSSMVDYSYDVLYKERKITRYTAEKYMIGWRPDYNAWVIPFWRGEPGNSEVDVVQFRKVSGKPKYIGLAGHNRGAVMNAHLLQEEQPYLVVLFHAFDPILAVQEGILAVGTNGSFPFRQDDKERVQELFGKQKNIYIVPDNNAAEFKAAYKLQEWIGGQVKYFPAYLPHNTDYIDYRQAGYSAADFKREVLELDFPVELVKNVVELLKVGDPHKFARYHAYGAAKFYPPQRVVQEIDKYGPLNYTKEQWNRLVSTMREAQDRERFFVQMEKVSELAFSYTGGW